MKKKKLTHFSEDGQAKMVDISNKEVVTRSATATGSVLLSPSTISLLKKQKIEKGNVLTVSKIAGIAASKKTSELIPLTHQINLDNIDIKFKIDKNKVIITSHVKTSAKTGPDVEALTAVSVCALTIYDMLKAVDKNITISDIYLVEKQKL